jgi:hypothetical protein
MLGRLEKAFGISVGRSKTPFRSAATITRAPGCSAEHTGRRVAGEESEKGRRRRRKHVAEAEAQSRRCFVSCFASVLRWQDNTRIWSGAICLRRFGAFRGASSNSRWGLRASWLIIGPTQTCNPARGTTSMYYVVRSAYGHCLLTIPYVRSMEYVPVIRVTIKSFIYVTYQSDYLIPWSLIRSTEYLTAPSSSSPPLPSSFFHLHHCCQSLRRRPSFAHEASATLPSP